MGLDFCCNQNKKIKEMCSLAPGNEREIPVQKFKSSNDFLFNEIESKYNILAKIRLIDYINLLENYSQENSTLSLNDIIKIEFSENESLLSSYLMTIDRFQSFIENKLLKLSEVYDLIGKNDLMIITFKEVFLENHKSLNLKLQQHYNKKDEEMITKLTLVPLGIIFSKSSIVGKIRLIFDLFKNDKNKFVKSESLDKYLICSFLICSYCMLSARKKIYRANNKLAKLDKPVLLKCLDVCELKDSQNLVKVFNSTFFDKEELNWYDFKQKFSKENSFQWILSSRGIRKKLEENNV